MFLMARPVLLGLLAGLATLSSAEPLVSLRNGTYAGLSLPQYEQEVFLGIPYAQDTGGENRFRIPQSLTETWDGVRDAKAYSPACPDEDSSDDSISGMGEYCLSINVVRPAGVEEGAKLPVMVWIHGGSYQVGTTALPYYNLTYIVQKSAEIGMPIIGASINYRKGAWGNMYSIEIQVGHFHPSRSPARHALRLTTNQGSGNTNLALRDMRKALEWIQENIESFGGNSSSVTIWGESSGSFAIVRYAGYFLLQCTRLIRN